VWAPYPKGYKRRPYTPSRTHGRSRCIPPLVRPRFKLLGFRFPLNRRGGSLFSFSFCFLFLFAVASRVCAEDFQVCPFAWPLAELPTFFLSPGLWPKEREGSARGERPPRSWLACWNGWPAGWPGLGRLAGLAWKASRVYPFAWPLADLPKFFLSHGLWPKEREGSARGGVAPSVVAGVLDWLACWLAWPWPAGWLGLESFQGLSFRLASGRASKVFPFARPLAEGAEGEREGGRGPLARGWPAGLVGLLAGLALAGWLARPEKLPGFVLSPGLWPSFQGFSFRLAFGRRSGWGARGREWPPRSWLACWTGWPAGWPGLGRLAGLAWAGCWAGWLGPPWPAGWLGFGWSQPPPYLGSHGVPPTDGRFGVLTPPVSI
jgi:hypothetical protein